MSEAYRVHLQSLPDLAYSRTQLVSTDQTFARFHDVPPGVVEVHVCLVHQETGEIVSITTSRYIHILRDHLIDVGVWWSLHPHTEGLRQISVLIEPLE